MIKEIEKKEEVLTKEFFITHLNEVKLELRKEIKEQGDDFQRYVGIVSENFQDKLSMVAEMVAQNSVDITEMKEDISGIKSDIHDIRYDLNETKKDVSVLKEDVSELKEDVSVLKQDMKGVKSFIRLETVLV